MHCTNCGKQIKDGIRFCPYCGKLVRVAENEKTGNVTEKRNAPIRTEKGVGNRRWIVSIAVAIIMFMMFICVIIHNTLENRIQRQLDLGQKYLENQQYEEACIAFEKAIVIDDMCMEAYAGGIEAYVHIEDTENLHLFYDKAIDAVRELDNDAMDRNMAYIIRIYSAADAVYKDEPEKVTELLMEGMELNGQNEQIITELTSILQNYIDILAEEERFDEPAKLAEKNEPMEIGTDFQTENQTGQWMLAEETRYSSDGNANRIEYEYEFMEAGQWVISKETYSSNDNVFWINYEYEYSGTGYIQKSYDSYGMYYENEFDENGNQINSKGYDNNEMFQWYDYEYDENGNQIKSELQWGSSEGGPWVIVYEYSENLLIKETSYGSADMSTVWAWVEYEYDAERNMLREWHYYFNDYESVWKGWGYRYEYAGNVVAKIFYDSDGNERLEEKVKYEYDDTGNMIKETHYSSEHSGISSWIEYTYVYLEPEKGE